LLQVKSIVPSAGLGLEASFAIPAVYISTATTFNWLKIFSIIYITISVLFIVRIFFQLFKIIRLIKKSSITKRDGILVAEHNENISPFSFMNYCFINPNHIPADKISDVLTHERAHYQKMHTADIMLYEVMAVFQWFNPFYWLIRKALVEVHEFQADKTVIQLKNDPYAYLDTIVSIAFNGIALPMGNNLNKSLTLKRLAMINITNKAKGTILKTIAASILSIGLVFAISCQSTTSPLEEEVEIEDEKVALSIESLENNDQIFQVVEEMPLFMGQKADHFREYISKNLKYPQIAMELGIQGRVFVSFVVETDGTVSNVSIERGVDPLLDKEAIRVVETSPKWTPGKQRGEIVRTKFTFPIIFKLE
jgi:TonB family protein